MSLEPLKASMRAVGILYTPSLAITNNFGQTVAYACGAISAALCASHNLAQMESTMLGRQQLMAVVFCVCGLGSTSASADVIFTLGNHPQSDEANILFSAPETGTTITGEVDHSGVAVQFSSLTGQTLSQNAQGQADIFSANGADLTSMFVTVPGYTFGDFILNLQNGTGTATVTAVDNFNDTFTYALGNGQNFLTLTTANGESIASISVTMSTGGGFSDFKQPRISQVCNAGGCVQVLPEPGALLLFGTTLLGIGVTARRSRS